MSVLLLDTVQSFMTEQCLKNISSFGIWARLRVALWSLDTKITWEAIDEMVNADSIFYCLHLFSTLRNAKPTPTQYTCRVTDSRQVGVRCALYSICTGLLRFALKNENTLYLKNVQRRLHCDIWYARYWWGKMVSDRVRQSVSATKNQLLQKCTIDSFLCEVSLNESV